MDFYDRLGVAALGSRLRRLGDRLSEDTGAVYELFENPLHPRWFPVYQVLAERGKESVSAIANAIGQSHASVSQIAKEMEAAGMLCSAKDGADTRKSYLSLTCLGREVSPRMNEQITVVGSAAKQLMEESQHNLWLALADCEAALSRVSLLDRVRGEKAKRDRSLIEIVGYRPELAESFFHLNEEWITHYFELETSDIEQLKNPEENIIDKGGEILFALIEGKCVGTCALIPHGESCLELAKMAISPSRRGLGLGGKLGKAAINRARAMGAKSVYLESNRRLLPAIRLYRALGFVEVEGAPSPYARADIQMELSLAKE